QLNLGSCFLPAACSLGELASDYHFEYTDCDVLGSRWRVAIPNKPETCTGLPDPVKGTHCTFSCNEGEFLDMRTQECQKCVAGTYSLGTGVAFDEWDTLPIGFVTFQDISNGCSTWIPKGDYIASNTDECTSTLSYAVSLKKPGSVAFQYFYPDNHMFFEFYVQNDQCQSTDSQRRWMKISESDWDYHFVQLNSGNNVLYWRTTGFSLAANTAKPVLLKNIAISGVSYTSECFHCKPGTYSDKPGAARCVPCPANSYSNKGATACQPCEADKYSGTGSGTCLQRPPCTTTDYFYTHTPCDSSGQTQLMYKWIEPKICSESVEGAVQLPASGEMMACPPCNPGFFSNNTSTCEPCPHGFYSNGTECSECPAGMEPVVGFEYKWWNKMPSNMRSSMFVSYWGLVVTGWEVAGDYIYTTPSNQDSDYMMLTLTVPGYSINCLRFVFMSLQGQSEWSNIVESWSGSMGKQSYSYLIKSNNTVSFTWGFQRTGIFSTKNEYSSDYAKIYSVHLTNVIGGVASECRQCALAAVGSESACVPCPPGHYMLNGTGVCKSCPSNTIIRPEQAIGKQACIPCGPNTYSNEGRSACMSDCTLALHHKGEMLNYDFFPLANVTSFQSSPRFTSKGLQYFHHFNVALCGAENRALASCVENVTESKRDVKGDICQSTVVPSEVRGQSVVSSQPFNIGDTLIGECYHGFEISIKHTYPTGSCGFIRCKLFILRKTTQACKNGRSASIRLRCDPTVTLKNHVSLPSNCSEGTCDGCSFHFLWRSQYACPLCSERNYKEIVSACIQGIQRTTYVWQQPLRCTGGVSLPPQKISACVTLDFWLKFGVSIGTVAALLLITISCYFWKRTRKLQYKYSRLMMTAGDKECELPAADSCAIMEGEDAEDDLIYLSKKSFFTKIKSFSRERTSDGFDSVPLKSSAAQEMEMN
uniref:Endosome-lysosome associated apoptosis and autophagy regulator 1 n=1 Tax=Cyprinus carpio carpio TaxID=630221 RepID=A0A8C1AQ31_CYPCA